MPDKIAPKVRRERIMIAAYAAIVSAAVLTWGAASYGTVGGALWMWAKVLGIPFITWNYSIGAAVYVHHIAQDITWHGRREWTKFRGQMEGTTILHIPAWLNFFYHNIFLHVAHHVDMRIPFYGLPAATDALREHYPDVVRERDYKLSEYVRTTKHCKLFDFEKGEWQGYPDPGSTDSVAATG
jgi:omega-6 fatty acid desaturase (delta-12 desaturase)